MGNFVVDIVVAEGNLDYYSIEADYILDYSFDYSLVAAAAAEAFALAYISNWIRVHHFSKGFKELFSADNSIAVLIYGLNGLNRLCLCDYHVDI